MIEFRPRDAIAVERLREHAVVALRFPRVERAIAAFAYGVSPEAKMVVDVEASCFRVGVRSETNVPLSRLIVARSPDAMGAQLTHAFAAHSWNQSSACSMTDLLDDSTTACEIAGVGRSVRASIAQGVRAPKPETLREASDRIDVLLLLLAGDIVSAEAGAAKMMLSLVSATCAPAQSMIAWVDHVLARLNWNIDANVATSVVRSAFPPVKGTPARVRFSARNRLAEALSDG